ncbi:hypothetical protein [Hymenobacter cellulosilyticus]|uniref:Uncharacterized protein n=1 Tax=Hymenobacter cellulosilyticus TaxID=2932248 RepID=A0A8T9Q5D9_9BACT|nr:hypothetical protein [Hymenobacter cellulosilyticus]UOQ72182.1 hypothetical protein MUN79_27070 [Hymenobacter cellulosilyticus]
MTTTIAAPAEISTTGRWLAGAQQLKDTLTILGMNILLLFGVLCGIAIPGLVLYFLRWKLVRGKGRRQSAATHWAITLVHELCCGLLFMSADMQNELHEWGAGLAVGYLLGCLISLAGLIENLGSVSPAPTTTPE